MDALQPLLMQFGEFKLDERDARLWAGNRALELTPKAFAVLCALARQPGQLLTKEALLDAVWGHRNVSESVLKTIISQLRTALCDNAKQPRVIETVMRRGYRFIALRTPPGSSASGHQPSQPTAPGAGAAVDILAPQAAGLIGRTLSLAALKQGLQSASQRDRQLMLVSGESGIGKTALIDQFVKELNGGWALAFGQCAENYGAGEPYMPVLEALNMLCNSASGRALLPLMRQVAPTWLAQLPWHLATGDRLELQREVAGATQDRMLRELGELLDRFSADQPLVVVLEDLHWSDHPTVQLISYLARRRTPAHLFILGSLRPTESISSDHPIHAQRLELRQHGLCTELILEAFSEREVADYLASRLIGRDFPESLVWQLHKHTNGLPLFVSSVVEELIAEQETGATDEPDWDDALRKMLEIPSNVSGVVKRQFARLEPQLQQWLIAASVAGVEFTHAPLATLLKVDEETLQHALDSLARRQQWLRDAGAVSLPDGRISGRYAFRHAIVREALYRMIGSAQLMQMHRRMAQALQQTWGSGDMEVSTELAMHFELGAALPEAIVCLATVARRALGRSAPQECLDAARHALELLATLPESSEKWDSELNLRVLEGVALTNLYSYTSPEAIAVFERAQTLCELLPINSARARVLHAMWWVNVMRSEGARATPLAQRMVALADDNQDPVLALAGHGAMAWDLAQAGEFAGALEHFDLAWHAYEQAGGELPMGMFVHDPGVQTLAYKAIVLWWMGRSELARESIDKAVALAVKLKHPLTLSIALYFNAQLESYSGEPESARLWSEQALDVARNDFQKITYFFQIVHGRALAMLGEGDAGLAEMREAAKRASRDGYMAAMTAYHHFYAEACLASDRVEDAFAAVEQGFALVERTGIRLTVSPLMQVRAMALARRGDIHAAQSLLRRAFEVAKGQGAHLFAIEALLRLCKLSGPNGQQAQEQLRAALDAVVEQDCPVFRAARALVGAGLP